MPRTVGARNEKFTLTSAARERIIVLLHGNDITVGQIAKRIGCGHRVVTEINNTEKIRVYRKNHSSRWIQGPGFREEYKY